MPETEPLTICFVCKEAIASPEEPVTIVEIDRYTLQRQLVEVEGQSEACHAGCVPLAGPNWRPPRERDPHPLPAKSSNRRE